MKKSCIQAFKIIFVVVLIIAMHYIAMLALPDSYGKTDIVDTRLVQIDPSEHFPSWINPNLVQCCSIWPISHFLLYTILGFVAPDCTGLLFTGGILWEIVEHWVSGFFPGLKNLNLKGQYSTRWWGANLWDIPANGLGLLAGVGLKKIT
jgi:hypothetical protein